MHFLYWCALSQIISLDEIWLKTVLNKLWRHRSNICPTRWRLRACGCACLFRRNQTRNAACCVFLWCTRLDLQDGNSHSSKGVIRYGLLCRKINIFSLRTQLSLDQNFHWITVCVVRLDKVWTCEQKRSTHCRDVKWNTMWTYTNPHTQLALCCSHSVGISLLCTLKGTLQSWWETKIDHRFT